MEMTGVETVELLVFRRIAEIKFVRADDIRFRADAEQLRLDRVEMEFGVERFLEDGVEGDFQTLARTFTIDLNFLGAVGNPDVGHRGRAELTTHFSSDFSTGNAVLDPEGADGCFRARQGPAIIGQRVREVGRIKIESCDVLFAPVDPALEMSDAQGIALDFLAAEIGIAGVQIKPVLAGKERERNAQVLPQFIECACFAGIISRAWMPPPLSSAPAVSKPPTSSPCQQCRERGVAAICRKTDSVSTPRSA